MIWLYYLAFSLALAIVGPLLLLRKKSRAGLAQKLGFVPAYVRQAAADSSRRIWFHCVSVGEFNATYPLLQSFKQQHPEYAVFVSTTTATGQKLAQDKVGSWATVFYFPFDLAWATAAWLDAVRPEAAVIAETELWPGFMTQCAARGVKLACINGRISPRSFKRYEKLKWFFRPVLKKFDLLAVQSEQEALRYRSLGAKEDAVVACGNMKFDGITAVSEEKQQALRRQLALSPSDVVLVAGSTHEGEETALIAALQALETPVRLIIAPRHPERFERVLQIIQESGFIAKQHTLGDSFTSPRDVYVVDTIGQLLAYYSQATIAFVGGTIAPIGGHSLIEPFAYGVPVVCGPHTEKTRDVAQALLQREALKQTKSNSELTAAIAALIASPQVRLRMGFAGKQYVADSQGAVDRTLRVLWQLLTGSKGCCEPARSQAATGEHCASGTTEQAK